MHAQIASAASAAAINPSAAIPSPGRLKEPTERSGPAIARVTLRERKGLSDFAPNGVTRRLSKGQTLICDGEAAENCFELVRGIVRVYKILSDGRRQIVDFLFPGDILGLPSGDASTCSADAVTDTVVRVFRRSALERIARHEPKLARILWDAFNRELQAAQAHIVLLGRKTAAERVASFFLALLHRKTEPELDGRMLWMPISQSDIADYLGLTTETVNRVIAQLREMAVIATPSRGLIRVERFDELEDLACAI